MGFLLWTYLLLCCIVRIKEVSSQYLTMNREAFDDQYEGCAEAMERHVRFSLLNKEKTADPEFREIWEHSELEWKNIKSRRISVPSGFQDEYGIALVAYTKSKKKFQLKFKEAVRNYERKNFKYHSLHFLLTRAMFFLRSSCHWSPRSTQRLLCSTHLSSEHIGEEVRFGYVFSSFKNQMKSREWSNGTFLTITSCFAVDIKEFSYQSTEGEFLIPPDEVFKVTDAKDGEKPTLALETTRKMCHYYNCDYLCEVITGTVDPACCSSPTDDHCFEGGKYSTCTASSSGSRLVSPTVVVTLLLFGFFFFTIKVVTMC